MKIEFGNQPNPGLIKGLLPSFALDGGVGGSTDPRHDATEGEAALVTGTSSRRAATGMAGELSGSGEKRSLLQLAGLRGRARRRFAAGLPTHDQGVQREPESEITESVDEKEEAMITLFGPERAGSMLMQLRLLDRYANLLGHPNPFTQNREDRQFGDEITHAVSEIDRIGGLIKDPEFDDVITTAAHYEPILCRTNRNNVRQAAKDEGRWESTRKGLDKQVQRLSSGSQRQDDAAYLDAAFGVLTLFDTFASELPSEKTLNYLIEIAKAEFRAADRHAFALGSRANPDLKKQYDKLFRPRPIAAMRKERIALSRQIIEAGENEKAFKGVHRTSRKIITDEIKLDEHKESAARIARMGTDSFSELLSLSRSRAIPIATGLVTELAQLKRELTDIPGSAEDRVLAEEYIATQGFRLKVLLDTHLDYAGITKSDVTALLEKPLARAQRIDRNARRGGDAEPIKRPEVEDTFKRAFITTRDILTGRYTEGSGPEECADRLRSLEESEFFQRRALSVLGELIPANDPTIIGPVGIALLSAIASGYSFSVSDIAAMQLVVDDFAAHSRGYRQRNVTAVQQENSDAYHAMLNSIEHTLDLRNVIERLAEIASSHSLMQDISEVMVGQGAEIGDSYRMQQRIHSELGNIVSYFHPPEEQEIEEK